MYQSAASGSTDVLHAPDKNCAVLSRLQLWTAALILVVIAI